MYTKRWDPKWENISEKFQIKPVKIYYGIRTSPPKKSLSHNFVFKGKRANTFLLLSKGHIGSKSPFRGIKIYLENLYSYKTTSYLFLPIRFGKLCSPINIPRRKKLTLTNRWYLLLNNISLSTRKRQGIYIFNKH